MIVNAIFYLKDKTSNVDSNKLSHTISSSIVFSVVSRGVQAKLSTGQIVTGTENDISIDGSLSQDLDNPGKGKTLQVICYFSDIYSFTIGVFNEIWVNNEDLLDCSLNGHVKNCEIKTGN